MKSADEIQHATEKIRAGLKAASRKDDVAIHLILSGALGALRWAAGLPHGEGSNIAGALEAIEEAERAIAAQRKAANN